MTYAALNKMNAMMMCEGMCMCMYSALSCVRRHV